MVSLSFIPGVTHVPYTNAHKCTCRHSSIRRCLNIFFNLKKSRVLFRNSCQPSHQICLLGTFFLKSILMKEKKKPSRKKNFETQAVGKRYCPYPFKYIFAIRSSDKDLIFYLPASSQRFFWFCF